MNNVIIYLDYNILSEPLNPLYFMFSKEVRSNFFVSSSFLNIDRTKLNIFTNLNESVLDFIYNNKIDNYILILDGGVVYDLNNKYLDCLVKARKVFIVGEDKNNLLKISNIYLLNIVDEVSCDSYKAKFTYEKYLSKVYSDELENIDKNLYVLADNDISYWVNLFRKKGVEITQLPISLSSNDFCLKNFSLIGCDFVKNIYPNGNNLNLDGFVSLLSEEANILIKNRKVLDGINIVCFNPTYLFKDLVDRFVKMGCVHSDFPLEGYNAYIWMRPQEIWHLEYIKAGTIHKEISKRYFDEGEKFVHSLDLNDIKKKSVVIHHGTCYEPLYQFEYNLLAKSIYNVKKVLGVCEFEECYGPSKEVANINNFEFVPIGYDLNLFKKELINSKYKGRRQKINIGFVGRAYGTNDFSLLAKSKMAEPKGYRKGGDILEAIVNKLKVINVDFHLHILGQNWEYLVEYFDQAGINYTYYARDKNITYIDYPQVYSKLDTLLISARCEGGPVSAIEALSLGIPIVSTNVGVVKYLDKNLSTGVYTFNYDKKWHIADISEAVKSITQIFENPYTYEQRLEISNSVESYTTDYWVERIIHSALS